MKAHIRWIFFERGEMSKLILNEENNENWPNEVTFVNWFNQSDKKIKAQQEEINLLEIKNNQTTQLLANIQTWFIKEHNLLSKPAKRAIIEKLAELNRLERELKVHQRELNHPKEELKEEKKECLENKIKIGERKIANCKDEVDEVEKLWREEEKELCQRLSYTKDDLQPYLRNPEERIDPITRKLLITSKHYHELWRKFNDIHPESEPLNKLNKLLDEWYTHNKGEGPEPNPHEIWVEEKTDDSITFVWIPAEIELVNKDDKGKETKVKGKFLSLLKNYLFNYLWRVIWSF